MMISRFNVIVLLFFLNILRSRTLIMFMYTLKIPFFKIQQQKYKRAYFLALPLFIFLYHRLSYC